MAVDGIKWTALAVIEKFSPEQTAFATDRLHGIGLRRDPTAADLRAICGEPEHGVLKEPGNSLVNAGLTLITELIIGGGGTPLAHADAIIGVGSGSSGPTLSDVALDADGTSPNGTTGAWYQQADSGFPTQALGVVTVQATFASGNANQAWNEWCMATGSGGITAGDALASVATSPTMLNHKIASLGTKGSGAAWVGTFTITFS